MTIVLQKTLVIGLLMVSILMGAHLALGQSGGWTTPAALTGYLYAGVQNNADGTAQGMGWISLNCENDGSCAASNYRVEIDPSTRELTGYAWGGNTASADGSATGLGWLRFGGLTGCPAGADCDARITGNDTNGYEVTGWARACSVFADPAACSGALAPAATTGDWDGWLSLNCDNHEASSCTTYRVVVENDGTFGVDANGGAAWGSDVLGLVSFRYAGFEAPACGPAAAVCNGASSEVTSTNLWCESTGTVVTTCPNGCNATTGYCNTTTLTGSFTVTPAVIRRGEPAQVTWSYPGAGTCDVSGPGTDGITNTTNLGTNEPTAPLTQSLSTFVLTCDGVEVARREVRVLPSVFES